MPNEKSEKITILKFKVLKNEKKPVYVEYNKYSGEGKPEEYKASLPHEPHPDLIEVFRSFDCHCAIINEFVEILQDKHFEHLDAVENGKHITPEGQEIADNFHTTGFTITEGKDFDSVILTCTKKLKSGLSFNFNTPSIILNPDAENAYRFTEDLITCIADARKEGKEYLRGKRGPEVQGDLFKDQQNGNKSDEKKEKQSIQLN